MKALLSLQRLASRPGEASSPSEATLGLPALGGWDPSAIAVSGELPGPGELGGGPGAGGGLGGGVPAELAAGLSGGLGALPGLPLRPSSGAGRVKSSSHFACREMGRQPSALHPV